MSARWIEAILALVLGFALATGFEWFHHATFEQRWQPVIDHPLYQKSNARVGFCFPGKCRVV